MSPGAKIPKRKHIADQEVERLERLVEARKMKVADAQHKLDEARQRAKTKS